MKKRPDWEHKDGYKFRVVGDGHKHKLSFFCSHCDRITGTIDDEALLKYGFCQTCYVVHVEERKVPTIDLAKYKKVK